MVVECLGWVEDVARTVVTRRGVFWPEDSCASASGTNVALPPPPSFTRASFGTEWQEKIKPREIPANSVWSFRNSLTGYMTINTTMINAIYQKLLPPPCFGGPASHALFHNSQYRDRLSLVRSFMHMRLPTLSSSASASATTYSLNFIIRTLVLLPVSVVTPDRSCVWPALGVPVLDVPVLRGTFALLDLEPLLCFSCSRNSFHLLYISRYALIENLGW